MVREAARRFSVSDLAILPSKPQIAQDGPFPLSHSTVLGRLFEKEWERGGEALQKS